MSAFRAYRAHCIGGPLTGQEFTITYGGKFLRWPEDHEHPEGRYVLKAEEWNTSGESGLLTYHWENVA